MAQNPSFLKRQKELARLEKQHQKQEKRKQRKLEKKDRGSQDDILWPEGAPQGAPEGAPEAASDPKPTEGGPTQP